jgi:hypothetical protein
MVLSKQLNVKYRIKEEKLYTGTDMSADWWVILDDNSRIFHIDERVYIKPDASDIKYYKHSVKENFSLKEDLNEYTLYRAEIPLGESTICENLPCNIYILSKQGDPNLFIGISKI